LSILSGAALLLAILVVSLVWLAPLISANENLEIQARQQEELARKYREKLTQAQSIRDNLVKQEQELKQMQKRLFRGNDPYQLAASLGELLSSKGGQKMDIKTYQVLASKEYGLYQEVHLRFNFMTTVDGLYFFLDRVKNFETALLVHEINVQKVQRAKGPDLVVNVILAALMEKGEKS
jgi:Tfp pilus assembly protein PilO